MKVLLGMLVLVVFFVVFCTLLCVGVIAIMEAIAELHKEEDREYDGCRSHEDHNEAEYDGLTEDDAR